MGKDTKYWEAIRDEAIKGCAEVWPVIQRTRTHLHGLELIHGEHEVKRLEAEQHLVEVIKVGKKHKAPNLVDIIAELSPEQRIWVVKALTKATEVVEEQDGQKHT